jgi:hypothetical protein
MQARAVLSESAVEDQPYCLRRSKPISDGDVDEPGIAESYMEHGFAG